MRMDSKANGINAELLQNGNTYLILKGYYTKRTTDKYIELMKQNNLIKELYGNKITTSKQATVSSAKHEIKVALQENIAQPISTIVHNIEASEITSGIITQSELSNLMYKNTTSKVKHDKQNIDNIAIQVEFTKPNLLDNKVTRKAWILSEELKSLTFENAELYLTQGNIEKWFCEIYKILPYSIMKQLIGNKFLQPNSKILVHDTAQHNDFISTCYLEAWTVLTEWQIDGINDLPILSYTSKNLYNLLKGYTRNNVLHVLRTQFTINKYDKIYDAEFNLNGTVYSVQSLIDFEAVNTTYSNLISSLTTKEAEYIKILATYGSKAIAQGKTSDGKKVKRIKGNKVADIKYLCKTLTSGYNLTDAQIIMLHAKLSGYKHTTSDIA